MGHKLKDGIFGIGPPQAARADMIWPLRGVRDRPIDTQLGQGCCASPTAVFSKACLGVAAWAPPARWTYGPGDCHHLLVRWRKVGTTPGCDVPLRCL